MVLARHVCVETSAVLFEIAARRVTYRVLGDIGNAREPTADAGHDVAYVGEVLLAQACGQRRAYIQALSRNRVAAYAFSESGILAGCGADHGAGDLCSRESKIGGRDAVCRPQSCKRGRWKPLDAARRDRLALSLVGEEGKDFVLPDRSTDAAAKLVVAVFIPEQATLGGR